MEPHVVGRRLVWHMVRIAPPNWRSFRQPSSGLKRSWNSWLRALHESLKGQVSFQVIKDGWYGGKLGFCIPISDERSMPSRIIASLRFLLSCLVVGPQ